MKRYYFLAVCTLFFILSACAGGKPAHRPPKHISAGMEAIKKGNGWFKKGCYRHCLEYFFMAHELFTASDQPKGVSMSLNNIGNVYRITGDTKKAILYYEESFQICMLSHDYEGAVQAISNRAAGLIKENKLEEAEKVLDTADSIADKNNLVFVSLLKNRGILFIKKKEYDHAQDILHKALASVDPKNNLDTATVNYALGTLMLKTGKFEIAVPFFQEALDADRISGFYKGIADDLSAMGTAFTHLEKYDTALNYFKRSIKIYALIRDHENVTKIREHLDMVSEKTGADSTLTKYFVTNWLEGDAQTNLCD